jgi:hypothetical protein
MSCYLLPDIDCLDDPECDVFTLSEELAIVVAVMLYDEAECEQDIGPERRRELTLTNLAGPRKR